MTKTEELEKMRNILYNLGLAQIGSWKDDGKKLQKMLDEIRYGYVYNLMNSTEGESGKTIEKRRIESLERLEKVFETVEDVKDLDPRFPGWIDVTGLKG